MNIITEKLITFTENILTNRKKAQIIKKEKQKNLHPFFDWLSAFLWAACFVLILNQYLFQGFSIPSRSMESTLEVGDRLIINKFVYGPELLPGILKLPGITEPERSDVIIFENPDYLSKGAFFDLAQRLVFMLTLSVVDLDKNSDGTPAHHFLIKRVVGGGGDLIRFNYGELIVKSLGEDIFTNESFFKEKFELDYNTRRLLAEDNYIVADRKIRESVYLNQNSSFSLFYDDLYFSDESNNKYLSHISPSKLDYYQDYNKKRQGIYIPNGWVLPLGDNRDNSKDGRYFGIVRNSEILGKATLKFWPFTRIGEIR